MAGLYFLCLAVMVTCACSRAVVSASDDFTPVPQHSSSVAVVERMATPERIMLNLTMEPATSQAVTWRTAQSTVQSRAQIAPATGIADFDKNADTVDAKTQRVVLTNGEVVYHHAVVFDSLDPDTLYAYRVGSESIWSEWNQFRTAGNPSSPFTFVYFGDPQNQIKSKCSRVFRAAFHKAPDADFWHFVGDLVNDGEADEQWGELFDAFGWIPRTTPMILLPGNHEYPDKRFVQGSDYRLSPLWRSHFTLPENGPDGLTETVYAIDYQGARLVMLNGNERLEEQASWLDGILSQNPQAWTIVAIHQPIYATGKYRNRASLQHLFLPIFDKHRVDLVLQGHDHTYSRSARIKNGVKAKPQEPGTVYITSVSGPKSYPFNPRYHRLMEKTGSGRQLFQVIRVFPERLEYSSFDATGTLQDSFVLDKKSR